MDDDQRHDDARYDDRLPDDRQPDEVRRDDLPHDDGRRDDHAGPDERRPHERIADATTTTTTTTTATADTSARPASRLGIIGFVLGLVSLWFPLLAPAGLVVGIAGIRRRDGDRAFAIAGTAISGALVAVGVLVLLGFAALLALHVASGAGADALHGVGPFGHRIAGL